MTKQIMAVAVMMKKSYRKNDDQEGFMEEIYKVRIKISTNRVIIFIRFAKKHKKLKLDEFNLD
jgi:hypothetical protein